MSIPAWGQEPEAPQPKKQNGYLKAFLVIVGIIVALIIIVGIAGGHNANSGSTSVTVPPTPTTAAATTDAPAPSPTPTPTQNTALAIAQQITNWWNGGGSGDTSNITRDFSAIVTDASNSDLTSLSGDCSTLSSDITVAQSYDPIPDAQAQTRWKIALTDYQQGADDCVAGANAQDPATITKASNEMASGNTELNAVSTRIKAIGAAIG